MSGLAGLWRPCGSLSGELLTALSRQLLAAMPHRGVVHHLHAHAPLGVSIAACRPAQGPVSATMAQSADERYVVALAGDLFPSRDESPVLWAMQDMDSPADRLIRRIRSLGIERALAQTRGAVCVAIVDTVEATLTLARDKLGEKTLYVANTGDGLVFATELEAVTQLAGPLSIDNDAIATQLRYGYIPAPRTIYRDVCKLPAGAFMRFRLDRFATVHSGMPSTTTYWDLREEAVGGIAERGTGDLRSAEADLREVLARSIDARHGKQSCAWLTGDVESSVIAAILQSQQDTPLQTFAVAIDEQASELDRADRIAGYLGCHFDPLVLAQRDVRPWVERSIAAMGEPDAQPFSTLLGMVAGTAGLQYNRMLLGHGANELFFGHDDYRRTIRQAKWLGAIPSGMRQRLGTSPWAHRLHAWNGRPRDPLVRLGASSVESHYDDTVAFWQHPSRAVPGASVHPTIFSDPAQWLDTSSAADRLQYIDQRMSLAEGLLPAADRACMAHGVTPYFPFLDESVLRFAWRLPLAHRYGYRQHKLVLRRLAERYLPEKLLQPHKPPAKVPIAAWLRGPLREWAGDLLNRRYLQQQGIFNPDEILPVWEAFLEGRNQWHRHLWPICVFQAWQQQQQKNTRASAASTTRRSCESRNPVR